MKRSIGPLCCLKSTEVMPSAVCTFDYQIVLRCLFFRVLEVVDSNENYKYFTLLLGDLPTNRILAGICDEVEFRLQECKRPHYGEIR